MAKHKVFADHRGIVLNVDGEKYIIDKMKLKKIDGVEHIDQIDYKKLDDKELEDAIKTIVKALAKKVTKEELLRELILNSSSMNYLKRLSNKIKKNQPIKKHKGCIGFKIGKTYMQLID